MKYFMTSSDEFSVVDHPMQPHARGARHHRPALLFLRRRSPIHPAEVPLRTGKNRRTGITSWALILPMALSLLPAGLTNETLREVMAWHTDQLCGVRSGIPTTCIGRSKSADA
jgi:hypothetical protein